MRALAASVASILTVVALTSAPSAEAARDSRDAKADRASKPAGKQAKSNAPTVHARAGAVAGRKSTASKHDRAEHAAAAVRGASAHRALLTPAPRAGLRGRSQVASAQRTSLAPRLEAAPRATAPAFSGGSIARATGLHSTNDPLDLHSAVALVFDQETGRTLYEKNATAVLPIASITKLMTALVALESGDSLHELIQITQADVDTEKHSSSRLRVGATLTRNELLQLALMASENRAAHALARRSRMGLSAFVAAMNAKARSLGMHDTFYADPTGLSSRNVSTARDLVQIVRAASEQPLVRQYSTALDLTVALPNVQTFRNTNRLVKAGDWDISLQKTGYISEAGRCMVLQTRIQGRPTIVVLLDAYASQARATDAIRIRRWLETGEPGRMTS